MERKAGNTAIAIGLLLFAVGFVSVLYLDIYMDELSNDTLTNSLVENNHANSSFASGITIGVGLFLLVIAIIIKSWDETEDIKTKYNERQQDIEHLKLMIKYENQDDTDNDKDDNDDDDDDHVPQSP